MSKWTQHKEKWSSCNLCDLCEKRTKVVLTRGNIPCEVLFIAEAPGPSEDVIGRPLVGPAGKMLDDMIEDAVENVRPLETPPNKRSPWEPPTFAFTNLISCIPLDDASAKFGEPPRYAILACRDRLREFVAIAQPKLIVCVGKLAEKWVPKLLGEISEQISAIAHGKVNGGSQKGKKITVKERSVACDAVRQNCFVSITHPAAILRADVSQRALAIQRTIITLSDAFEEFQ